LLAAKNLAMHFHGLIPWNVGLALSTFDGIPAGWFGMSGFWILRLARVVTY
jgi:hypothetical protein